MIQDRYDEYDGVRGDVTVLAMRAVKVGVTQLVNEGGDSKLRGAENGTLPQQFNSLPIFTGQEIFTLKKDNGAAVFDSVIIF